MKYFAVAVTLTLITMSQAQGRTYTPEDLDTPFPKDNGKTAAEVAVLVQLNDKGTRILSDLGAVDTALQKNYVRDDDHVTTLTLSSVESAEWVSTIFLVHVPHTPRNKEQQKKSASVSIEVLVKSLRPGQAQVFPTIAPNIESLKVSDPESEQLKGILVKKTW